MSTFLSEKELPAEFTDPIVKGQLSFNGQLHFRCRSCDEVSWIDVTLGKLLLASKIQGIKNKELSCPKCKKNEFESICFEAFECRLCNKCGSSSYASRSESFECGTCHNNSFTVEKTTIHPSYPKRLYTPFRPKMPFGVSPNDDVEFLRNYLPVLRVTPDVHNTYIHFVSFIESIYEQVYGSSAEATDLLNIASSMMRRVFKETKNRDAAYLSIELMMKAQAVSETLIQRAVYGFNINQNIYSALALREEEY
ncbi:hypothetical protein PDESU_01244 [Pontiella desulfatans]|uniref:Uncharacterized protein n=1 Tax=Pontiella desulfatans TaxID=2750659 RepID=A0A6C2TZA6_PONDE|nr:hypothetical protein [Pontiella desulfatans]VGO12691.1 hypothetical protein PDESU_01244 [Pontiella desulfatans]